ncbi:excinuclease ABC subunit UvrB [Candidatus Micrarchaeota archaeon]|nr:excinuclease ABC subunit UvrB [Candidatus Micrarchaeota archaeon]
MDYQLQSDYYPAGDQPEAIRRLTENAKAGGMQTLMGVTGSGKTFSMANVIAKSQKPVIVISHNKTLAAQLYSEFQQFFPKNNVGYFISYYDYYQPESYIAQTDTYIEKSSDRNAQLEQFRMQATSHLLSGEPTVIVASVSCIYGLGDPGKYRELGLNFKAGQIIPRDALLEALIAMQYQRNDAALDTGKFRLRGETLEVFPPFADEPVRVVFDEGKIEKIEFFDLLSGKKRKLANYLLLPAKHFVVPEEDIKNAIKSIKKELDETLPGLPPLEEQRLRQKTNYDLEMISEVGYCSGIENYSRHFDGREEGERPYCLLDYFPNDLLMFIDESHVTIPQIRGMYFGDRSRKRALVENGFRLPSAYDNRPLKFNEFEHFMKNVIFVSATPADYEREHSRQVIEQIVRPTGLLDPEIEVRKTEGQVENLRQEILMRAEKGQKTLVTTLTKKMAEDLASYLHRKGIRVRYLHSEIDTLERTKLIREMRRGKFDCLVGINLLREGLDIPEVSLVAILDADKTGFLRSAQSLIQTIGRAARNEEGKVIMYADSFSEAMKAAITETGRRRKKQQRYNLENGITPKTIKKPIPQEDEGASKLEIPTGLTKEQKKEFVEELEEQMKMAAEELSFERAIDLREQLRKLKKRWKK